MEKWVELNNRELLISKETFKQIMLYLGIFLIIESNELNSYCVGLLQIIVPRSRWTWKQGKACRVG
jgi:hypothetical protein